jgi:hypothetical protein
MSEIAKESFQPARNSFTVYLYVWEIPSNKHKSIPADAPNINHKARQGRRGRFHTGDD